MSKFNVGDLVFDCLMGWTVVEISDGSKCPVMISSKEWFYGDGRSSDKYDLPRLYTKEEALVKFPEFPLPKRMKKVKRWISMDTKVQPNLTGLAPFNYVSSVAYATREACLSSILVENDTRQIVEFEMEIEE